MGQGLTATVWGLLLLHMLGDHPQQAEKGLWGC